MYIKNSIVARKISETPRKSTSRIFKPKNPPIVFYINHVGLPLLLLLASQSIRQLLSKKLLTMDFPGHHGVFKDTDDFNTAPSPIQGDYTCELYSAVVLIG